MYFTDNYLCRVSTCFAANADLLRVVSSVRFLPDGGFKFSSFWRSRVKRGVSAERTFAVLAVRKWGFFLIVGAADRFFA